MNSQTPRKSVDPAILVQTIIGKTKDGKIRWEETADENTFIASVGGNTTLRANRYFQRFEGYSSPILTLLDIDGRLLWELNQPELLLSELFDLADRKSVV